VQLWELDIELKAAAGGIRSSTQSSIGLIAEAAWLPLPPPLGRGNVATFLLKKGSIALVDVAQRPEVRATRRARSEALRQLLNASDKSTAHQTTLLDIGQEDGFEIDERARDRTAHSKRDGGPAVHLADGPKCASALCLAPARLALLQLILQVCICVLAMGVTSAQCHCHDLWNSTCTVQCMHALKVHTVCKEAAHVHVIFLHGCRRLAHRQSSRTCTARYQPCCT
jgi:hypothetical protein